MGTVRTFAYNSGSAIQGTTQVGFIAAGLSGPIKYNGSIAWWPGPDEDLRYIICHTSGERTAAQGTIPVAAPTIGFWGSALKTEASFLSMCNDIFNQGFTNAGTAISWLNTNGYWTSYTTLAGSLVFNGSNQSLGLSPGVNFHDGAFTVEGWFYVTGDFTNRGILGVPVSNNLAALNLFFSDNKRINSDKNGGGGSYVYEMPAEISLNAWHYFIYNRNSNGSTAVYIDGVRSLNVENDQYDYSGLTDTIGRYYGGYWRGYWTNMRISVGTAVYDSNDSTQTNPTSVLGLVAGTEYLMLGAAVQTDTAGIQTVTNNNGVTQNGTLKPF
jgi:hypothetical protein